MLRYSEGDKVSQSVGFYYMANAAGRLSGTLVSGALYSYVDPALSTRGMGSPLFFFFIFRLMGWKGDLGVHVGVGV